MKKFILFLTLVFSFLFFPIIAFCQDTGAIDLSNPGQYFASISALAGLVIIITAFVNKILKAPKPFVKQLVSWLIAIALSLLGWWLKLGLFIGIEWYIAIIYGFACGLVANGIFDITIVKGFLSLFKLLKTTS